MAAHPSSVGVKIISRNVVIGPADAVPIPKRTSAAAIAITAFLCLIIIELLSELVTDRMLLHPIEKGARRAETAKKTKICFFSLCFLEG
jgi:hypothetical protein